MNKQAFEEIDNAVWFEDCEQMSDEDERLISMGTLRAVWKELVLLRDVRLEIERQIGYLKQEKPSMVNSTDIQRAWEECLDLVTNGVENNE